MQRLGEVCMLCVVCIVLTESSPHQLSACINQPTRHFSETLRRPPTIQHRVAFILRISQGSECSGLMPRDAASSPLI
jgi:hypothetical protein